MNWEKSKTISMTSLIPRSPRICSNLQHTSSKTGEFEGHRSDEGKALGGSAAPRGVEQTLPRACRAANRIIAWDAFAAIQRARKEAKAPKARKIDEKEELRAAAALEKEERRRKLQRQKEEIAAAKVRARRKAAIEKAEAALEDARRQHDEKAASIERDRRMLERRVQDEERRWQKLKSGLRRVCRKPAISAC
jgi:hypothetical protein